MRWGSSTEGINPVGQCVPLHLSYPPPLDNQLRSEQREGEQGEPPHAFESSDAHSGSGFSGVFSLNQSQGMSS